jgi:cytochrome c-type biogenesis protein CcmH/NrfG
MLANAESETLASMRLNPQEPDTRNLLGVIYAQEGKTAGAWMVWRELAREEPDYGPARKNLELLGSQNEVVLGQTAAVVLPPAAAVKTTKDQPKPSSPMSEPELAMVAHK